MNLIVKDGISETSDSLTRIHNVVKYVRSSPSRSQKFHECVEQERILCKSNVCLDVSTRWNSTYFMLEVAIKFQKAFERLEEEDPQFVTDLSRGSSNDPSKGPPKERDWEVARVLVAFLSKFYDATRKLSGTLYCTSNMYFQEVCNILSTLNGWAEDADIELQCMAFAMKEKFDKYWGNLERTNILLLIAAVLDPRFKLKYVKFRCRKFYTSERVDGIINRIMEVMKKMYEQYELLDSIRKVNDASNSSEMEVDQSIPLCSGNKDDYEFVKLIKEDEILGSRTEIDWYLEDNSEKLDSNFNILAWWNQKSTTYPILASMAKDVLAIPVSTVASESTFSTGGRVLDQFRSSLTPKIVECLICAQDWLRSSSTPIEVEENLDDLEEIESGNLCL